MTKCPYCDTDLTQQDALLVTRYSHARYVEGRLVDSTEEDLGSTVVLCLNCQNVIY